MGLLTLGTPLRWDDAKQHAAHIRAHGIAQFLNVYRSVRHRSMDSLCWGDELEYVVVARNTAKHAVQLTSAAHAVLRALEAEEHDSASRERAVDSQISTFELAQLHVRRDTLPHNDYSSSSSSALPTPSTVVVQPTPNGTSSSLRVNNTTTANGTNTTTTNGFQRPVFSIGGGSGNGGSTNGGDVSETESSAYGTDSASLLVDPPSSSRQQSSLSPQLAHDISETKRRRSSSNTMQELMLKRLVDPRIIDSSWKPEYGRFMIEATPAKPYGATLADFLCVECNMVSRRQLVKSRLKDGETLLSLTNFPLLGVPGFYKTLPTESNVVDPTDDVTKSLFIPTSAINPHARFPTLSANIRERRESKVAINLPIFRDKFTPSPFREQCPDTIKNLSRDKILEEIIPWSSSDGNAKQHVDEFAKKYPTEESLRVPGEFPTLPDVCPDAKEDHVYMDAMCFGMGCSCLQVTFQACNITEARRMYDQLANVTPIMLALSASSPVFRGFLVDTDCRWDVISASVDDRTVEERGLKPLNKSKFRLAKSRYDSISVYLSQGPDAPCNKVVRDYYKEEYNDLNPAIDQDVYKELTSNGVDSLLSRHYAHLFTRDPLVIFSEHIELDDTKSFDHFENIQSTNWQTVRFKPPPPNSSVGWRVEFRSMEIQLTDFENAAFAIFVVLFVRAVNRYQLNLYIPLSKVDINMKRSQVRDAIHTQKFWFRATIDPSIPGALDADSDAIIEMTLDEIMNGKPDSFGYPGLIPIVKKYLDDAVIPTAPRKFTDVDTPVAILPPNIDGTDKAHRITSKDDLLDFGLHSAGRQKLIDYLDTISHKASGKLVTGAKFIRDYIMKHPAYKHDSCVSQEIAFDLVNELEKLNNGSLGPSVPGLNRL